MTTTQNIKKETQLEYAQTFPPLHQESTTLGKLSKLDKLQFIAGCSPVQKIIPSA